VKVKQDFVTNSSSSSFIVAFDKPVESLDEIKDKIMFIEKAQRVFNDVQEQKPLKLVRDCPPCLKRVTEEIASGFFEGYESCWDDRKVIKEKDFPSKKAYLDAFNKIYDECDKINKRKAEKIASNFIEKNEGKVAYFFSYADENGRFESEMEHGDTFDCFPHIIISHH